ncbi:homeodomain-like/winged-helix DNA-binding family protein [Striga asiatica]|uniref:Homeodomain-like/winged-helix DNA-binding family protein n=1 Tax=Striga asiatica TaxID=4170 RepID=A0A5A7PXU7_STRAF|nr:homeodomain-like/winged-helix DNA-binding family protein [Striga asiatica]
MDSTTSVGRGTNQNNQRRSWTVEEERALIQGLKDLVARGWKADNGFRSGYTTILEQYMRQQFPTTTIRADPHISSKITVWKKNYILLAPLLAQTSGVGWSETGHMLEVDEPIWKDYVQVYPKAKALRNKSWPFYADWVEIFGKDRATGEGAEGFADALNEVLTNTGDDGHPHVNSRNDGIGCSFEGNEHETESSSLNGVESSASGKGKRVGKRKRFVEPEDQVVGLLSTLCEKADQRFSQMVERIGFQHDAKEQRKALYEALNCLPTLSTEEKFMVTKYFCKNNEELDIFFSLPDDTKASMVKMILKKRSASSITSSTMERHERMLLIAERYRVPGWSVKLTFSMQKYFSVLKVRTKINALRTYFREFLTYLETPGVEVHADSGLVRVNPTYWAYVGQETNFESFFRHVGFPWYDECVDLWDLRDAAEVDMQGGSGVRIDQPIMFDDTDESNGANDDAEGADDDAEGANDDAEGADMTEDMFGAANDVLAHLDEAAGGDPEGAEEHDDEDMEVPAPVEVIHIESDDEPEEMDIESDAESCVDSD